MAESKTSERRLAAIERQRRALELRKAGVTFQCIAEELGYSSVSGAYGAVASALKRTLQEPADEVRRLELERLDAALFAIWRRILGGDLGAIDRMLRLMDRRAKLLGLDAPLKVAPTDPSGDAPYDVMTDEERLERITAILDAARARGAGSAAADAALLTEGGGG